MPKMIPHRLIHKSFEENEVIRKLNQITGRSLLDEASNMFNIECEALYIFPLSLKEHLVFQVLAANSKLFLESDDNTVYLPLNPVQAYKLNKSPYSDPPIDSYTNGIVNILESISNNADFALCKSGDERALNSVRDHLLNVRKAMKDALENARLYAAFPYTDEDYQRDEAMRKNMTKQ